MCGRFSLVTPLAELARLFRFPPPPDRGPRYNIAPTQPVLVLRDDPGGERKAAFFTWGFTPAWRRRTGSPTVLINARSETAAEKSTFAAAFRERRCLVLADGFYEWLRSGRSRRPYHFRLRRGGPFAFAGLWEAPGPGEVTGGRCTILTTTPDPVVAPIHDRMPLILPPCSHDTWLGRESRDLDTIQGLCRPSREIELTATPVGNRVNDPKNDDPGCLDPLLF